MVRVIAHSEKGGSYLKRMTLKAMVNVFEYCYDTNFLFNVLSQQKV